MTVVSQFASRVARLQIETLHITAAYFRRQSIDFCQNSASVSSPSRRLRSNGVAIVWFRLSAVGFLMRREGSINLASNQNPRFFLHADKIIQRAASLTRSIWTRVSLKQAPPPRSESVSGTRA